MSSTPSAVGGGRRMAVEGSNEPRILGAVTVFDDLLSSVDRRVVYDFLRLPNWGFGWKSNVEVDRYAFWHKQYSGNVHPDHVFLGGDEQPSDSSEELRQTAPLLFELWTGLQERILRGHRLVRCYANGQAYGSEGTLHTDSKSPCSFTSIYYPHDRWRADWAGETVFFNKDGTDVEVAIFPRPNRLVTFPGTIPHVARGVSRTCPVLRITLMFKTETR